MGTCFPCVLPLYGTHGPNQFSAAMYLADTDLSEWSGLDWEDQLVGHRRVFHVIWDTGQVDGSQDI